MRRTSGALQIISIRPSWCQDERNIERNLGPLIRDLSIPQEGLWSYIDIYDLADAIVLSAAATTEGHEVLYIAAADNIGGRDMAAAIKAQYGGAMEIRAMDRVDSSGISCAKAKTLIGWYVAMIWQRANLKLEGHLLKKEKERMKERKRKHCITLDVFGLSVV